MGGVALEAGWVLACDLHHPERLDAAVAIVERGVAAQVDDPAETIANVSATFFLGWYLYGVASAAARPFREERRVPSLAPDQLAMRFAPGGWPDGVTPTADRFACLPDDPEAHTAAATVVPDEDALRAVLRDEVARHAEVFLAAWQRSERGRLARRGKRALWGLVTDALVAALWCAETPGGDAAGARSAITVLPEALSPYTAPAVFTGADDGCLTRQRAACCLAYRLASLEVCAGCPRGG